VAEMNVGGERKAYEEIDCKEVGFQNFESPRVRPANGSGINGQPLSGGVLTENTENGIDCLATRRATR
jgi:hypothetical protein